MVAEADAQERGKASKSLHLDNDEEDQSPSTVHALASDPRALARAYGSDGLDGILSSRYVTICAIVASVGGLTFGVDQGLISVILVMDHFLDEFPRVDDDATSNASFYRGLMTAMIELGAILGAISAGFLADRYSRRNAIRLGVVWFIIGSAIQTGSISFPMLVVGRLVGGVGIGTLSMVCPLFISELSAPHIRGVLLSLEEFAIVFGICLAYYVTYGTRFINSQWSFRLPFLLQIVPGASLGIATFLLPPSPRWLATKGRDDECLAVLTKLRSRPANDPLVQAEWLEIRAEVALHEEIRRERHPQWLDGSVKSLYMLEVHGWIDTMRPGCRMRTLVGVGLMFFQQFVGINALIYYSPTLFRLLGLDYNLQLTMSGVTNLCQLVGVCLSFLIVDRFGRKPLLILGSIGMTICMVIVAILTARFSSDWPAHQDKAWAGVAMILLYMVVFGLSWGPVPWAMPAEIFPSSLRAKGVAISVVSNWFNNLLIGLFTPALVSSTGYGAFVFFAVFAALSLPFVLTIVPETKGVPLEGVDALFGDRTGEEDKKRIERIEKGILEGDAKRRNRKDAGVWDKDEKDRVIEQ